MDRTEDEVFYEESKDSDPDDVFKTVFTLGNIDILD